MPSFKTTVLATAVLLAVSSGAAQAQTQPASEIQSLKNTVDNLRKQLDELRGLVQQRGAGVPVPGDVTAASAEESQESIDARTAATKADIQGMRTDLENYKYDQSRLQERNIPSVTRNTKIGGSVTVRYDIQNPAAPPSSSSSGYGPTDPRNRGFSASAFSLNFAGNLYRDYTEGRNLTYRLALSSQNSATSAATGVNLTDSYLRYSFLPSSGNPEDALGTITLGQQIVPFGLEAQALDPEVKAIIGSAGFISGLGLSSRQTGLVVSGDYAPYVDLTNNYRAPLLSYSLGVFNGNGANRADNNNYLDTIGRLVYTLPVDYSSWLRQLQIGSSYYRGYTSLGPDSTTAATTSTRKGHNDLYGVDVNWTHLPYSVTYEQAYGKKELLTPTAANPDGYQRGQGQYINFGYTWGEQFLASSKQQGKFDDYWPKSFQTFLRFDQWDPNRSGSVVNDKQFVTTLGLNVFFAETTKFQINYLHIRNQLGGDAPTAARPASVNAIQALLNATF